MILKIIRYLIKNFYLKPFGFDNRCPTILFSLFFILYSVLYFFSLILQLQFTTFLAALRDLLCMIIQVMAVHLKKILGDLLYLEQPDETKDHLPSPEELRNKVITRITCLHLKNWGLR